MKKRQVNLKADLHPDFVDDIRAEIERIVGILAELPPRRRYFTATPEQLQTLDLLGVREMVPLRGKNPQSGESEIVYMDAFNVIEASTTETSRFGRMLFVLLQNSRRRLNAERG